MAVVAAAIDVSGQAAGAGQAPTVEAIFTEARGRLERLARENDVDIKEFATTFAVVVITDDSFEVGQIGDSIVVLREPTGLLQALSPAEKFEYANETVFLTDSSWLSHVRGDRLATSNASGVALSTDGLRFKILDDLAAGLPYAPFFEDAFSWFDSTSATSEAVSRFIDRLDDQSGDDKTFVIAVRSEDAESRETVVVLNEFVAESAPEADPVDEGVDPEVGTMGATSDADGEDSPT